MNASPRRRRRLTAIEMLPAIAKPDLAWAASQLQERSMPQRAILERLNARLHSLALQPISRTAFNRWTVSIREGQTGNAAIAALRSYAENVVDIEDQIAAASAQFVATVIAKELVDGADAMTIASLNLAFRSAAATLNIAPVSDSKNRSSDRRIPPRPGRSR